jgi:hypothetical protein
MSAKARMATLKKLEQDEDGIPIPFKVSLYGNLVLLAGTIWYFFWFVIGAIVCCTILFIPVGLGIITFGFVGFTVCLHHRDVVRFKSTQSI